MPIFDTFSNRNRLRPERLTYDSLPQDLRLHCLRIIRQGLGSTGALLDRLDRLLQHEHPLPSFADERATDEEAAIFNMETMATFFDYCVTHGSFEEAMDAIEAGAHFINDDMRQRATSGRHSGAKQEPDEALDEMNGRFMQAGVGYQFSKEQGRLVRVDSEFMHQKVTEPAMLLVTEKGFEGAAQEFDKAHQHYRQMAVDPEAGKDAVAWAVKAVESTAKAIMDARGWPYEKSDTIVRLLEKLVTNGLVPPDLQSYFGGLRTALTSGLPTIGNRRARHGQGPKLKPIEEHMVTLAMHLAAATIRFLVEAHKAKEAPGATEPPPGHPA